MIKQSLATIMLFQTLELIRQNLDAFIKKEKGLPSLPDVVVLGNIAYATPDNPGTLNVDESAQIYISLVNIEEEFAFKNQAAVRPSLTNPNGTDYVNPPLHINAYLLFTANHKTYTSALEDLSLVLLFFQSNRVFSLASTPVTPTGVFANPGLVDEIRVRLDMISLTFEQINHLWGSLGGKQMPFILFKASKVEIDANRVLQGGGRIQEIQIN